MAIDIGSSAIDRPNSQGANSTKIDCNNPANANGVIDTIQIRPAAQMYNVSIGIFYLVSGKTYACRSAVSLGTVPAGLQTYTGLSLDVHTGDVIGAYWTGGSLECTNSGSGVAATGVNICSPGVSSSVNSTTYILSIYGTGSEVTVGPTVTSQSATDITYTTATGNGNITATGGENCTKRGICYSSTNATPTVADSIVEESGSFSTGAFTESLTGLSAGTLYYARAYAYNSAGYGYGDIVTFTTAGYSAPTVATQAATSIGQSSATLNGNVTADGGTTITVRGVLWDTVSHSSNPGGYLYSWSETGSFSTGAFDHDVSNLWAGATYYFMAYATNSGGTTYGDELTLTTLAGSPFSEVDLSDDDSFIYNEASIVLADGSEVVMRDDDAILKQGARTFSRSNSLIANTSDAIAQAFIIKERYKDSKLRANSLLILPDSSPADLWPKVLGYDISSRITLQLNSTRNPANLNQAYHIEGIEHEWNAETNIWQTRWQLWDVNQYRLFNAQYCERVANWNSNYTTCHDAASGQAIPAYQDIIVGQRIDGANVYYIYRSLITWDTSVLDPLPVIDSASILLYFNVLPVVIHQAFDIDIVSPGTVVHPISLSDYGAMGALSTICGSVSLTTDGIYKPWLEIPLNSTGLQLINNNSTKFVLRSSRDISSSAPADIYESVQPDTLNIIPILTLKLR